jgi:hypothetical protein
MLEKQLNWDEFRGFLLVTLRRDGPHDKKCEMAFLFSIEGSCSPDARQSRSGRSQGIRETLCFHHTGWTSLRIA